MKFKSEPQTDAQKWIRAKAFQFIKADKRLSYGKALTEATSMYIIMNRNKKKLT